MSMTIYGGKTRNGIDIDDMVDDNKDDVFRNDRSKGDCARFCQVAPDKDDLFRAPAIAIFAENEPFDPIWGIRLPRQYSDHTKDDHKMSDLFMKK
ncbi:MAG: hypothetical protein IK123_06645, partial [Lachnospiraceae bacterium]|nr:hypothetical protein [Lachnospiraceae bacterium]